MPASTLENQLQRIAVAAGVRAPQPLDQNEREYDPVGRKGKASLIYSSYQDAAEVGSEEVYELGLKGFEALCRLDPRFQSCRQTLFSQSTAVSFERGAQDAERLKVVDEQIDRFCRLLGPYFLLPAATHALEYLVRKFQVHENNVYALMKVALPYHGTPEFVRCVMIMRLKKTCFEFLSPFKKSPPKSGLSRGSLVQRCITDRALLRFVCDMARELSDPKTGVRSCMGWYAVVLCEYIADKSNIDEDLVAFLLPYIIHGVQGHVVTEYRDATYMVLGQLASRAQFSEKVFNELLPDITGSCTPGSLPQVLLLLGYLASSQDCFTRLPGKCYEHLSRLPTLFGEVKQITAKLQHSHAFGYLLFVAAVEHALEKEEHVESFSMLVKSLQMGSDMDSCAAFLVGSAKKPGTGEVQARLVALIKEFDVHHGDALENAINNFLAASDIESEERSRVMEVLGKSLEDTVRAPLVDANVTLAAGVDHASAGVRIMALEKLNDIFKSDGAMKEESETILKGVVLRRLDDDDFGVVLATLNLDQLTHLVPINLLGENLIACVERCMKVIYSKQTSKRTRGLARKSAIVALGHLSSMLEDETLLTGVLLSVLLAGVHSYKLSLKSLELLVEDNGTAFSRILGPLHKRYNMATVANGTKRSRAEESAGNVDAFDADLYNQDIIRALSKGISQEGEACDTLFQILVHRHVNSSAKAVTACILEAAVMGGGSKGKDASMKDKIARKLMQWFLSESGGDLLSQRRKSDAFKSLWDSRKKSLSSQALSDVASRSTHLCAIEPELLLACLTNMSGKVLMDLENPAPMEFYTYLANLPQNVWSQHMGVFLDKLENPVDLLTNIWGDESIEDIAHGHAPVTALQQWAEYISSHKLSADQKKSVSKSIIKLLSSLSSASRSMRKAALHSCSTLLDSIKDWWPASTNVSRTVVESLLEVIAKSHDRILADSDGLEYLLQQIIGCSDVKNRKKLKSPRSSDAKPALIDPESLGSYLLQELQSDADLQHTPLLIRVLRVGEDAGKLAGICASILEKSFTDIVTESFVSPLSPTQRAASLEMLNVLNDPAIHHVTFQSSRAILLATMKASTWKDEPELRQIALLALSKCVSSSTSMGNLQEACAILITAASTEAHENCRRAALSTLETLKLSADVLIPFLKLPQPSQQHNKRQKSVAKKTSETQDSKRASMSLCLHTLELLQWKRDIDHFERFVKPVQTLIKEFMVLSKDLQVLTDNPDGEAQGPATASFGIQLCLNVLLYISETAELEKLVRKDFNTGFVVECASKGTDHAVRTVALDLLRSRIESCPEDALNHILKTVEAVCCIVTDKSDKYSAELASKAMSTAAAAWIAGGNSMHDLVPKVIEAIQDTSFSRKYSILGALVDSVPYKSPETMASISYHLLVSDHVQEDAWKQDAAMSILAKKNKTTCVAALGVLLQMCLAQDTDNEIQLHVNEMAYKLIIKNLGALQRMQQKDTNIFESYDLITQSILRQLQLIGKARAKSSDPSFIAVENGAYKVLNALKDAMDSVQFIECVLKSLLHKDTTELMVRKSLSLLTDVASEIDDDELAHVSFYQCVHDTVGACISIFEAHGKKSEITRQGALDTLAAFSRKFGADYHDIFLQAIPATVDLINEDELPAIRGTSLVCLSTYIRSMKNAVIPMIPRIVPAVILGSSAALQENATQASQLDLSASLTALEALSLNLGSFMAPNMTDILRILLHKNVVESEDESCERLGKSCRRIISAQVPARLLLNPVCEMMDEQESLQGPSLKALFDLAADMIHHMDATAVATYHATVFSLVLQGLDLRRTIGDEEPAMTDSIESSVVNALLQLVLKLNETKFKPIFFRLVEWATTSPSGDLSPSRERKIAFFHVISVLTENLKSVFTPYFSSLTKPIVQVLEEENGTVLLLVLVIKSLTRCFLYDTSGFLDEHQFSKLLDPLIAIMKAQSGRSDEDSELMKDAAIEDMIPSPDVRASLGIIARYTIACMSQMATASGSNSESRWRPLHHAVLMVTRASNADARLAALDTTMAICDALQEEYLTLLPEALPFLSELLEDEDPRVEKRTVEVLKKMEDVSGEDLKQYLKQ